ncbi:MAG: hypothetical protein NTU53_00080 [Planctomycetota bacterium]|nr:hypothetical protein [Planctomycetota bacterium]
MSVNGRIEWRRVRYYADDEGSDSPIDRLVDEMESAITVGMRELCCRLGIAGRSFARSAENLYEAAQIRISEEKLRNLVESEGKAVLTASAQEQLELDWSGSDCKASTPTGQETSRMYASADGVLVPTTTEAEKQKRRATVLAKRQKMSREERRRLTSLGPVKKGSDQRYKQIYVTILYDQAKEHRLVGLTRKNHRGLGKLLGREASRVRMRAATERVGLVDGAVCLRNHLEVLPLEVVLLDFFHLSEHVNDASRKTLGEKTEAGKRWVHDVLHSLRHEGYEPFFAKLVDWRSGLRGGKRKEADRLLSYVAERQAMMGYAECEKRGWDVGTGPMESMCGVTTDRIKGRGRRWDLDNAEAVMALEAMYQSHLWDRYWAKALCHQN